MHFFFPPLKNDVWYFCSMDGAKLFEGWCVCSGVFARRHTCPNINRIYKLCSKQWDQLVWIWLLESETNSLFIMMIPVQNKATVQGSILANNFNLSHVWYLHKLPIIVNPCISAKPRSNSHETLRKPLTISPPKTEFLVSHKVMTSFFSKLVLWSSHKISPNIFLGC